jgi:hypothetical protein
VAKWLAETRRSSLCEINFSIWCAFVGTIIACYTDYDVRIFHAILMYVRKGFTDYLRTVDDIFLGVNRYRILLILKVILNIARYIEHTSKAFILVISSFKT